MPTYMTFGQSHAHSINGVTVDKDCIAVFDNTEQEARDYIRLHKDNKFFTTYTNETQVREMLEFYPKGLVHVGRV